MASFLDLLQILETGPEEEVGGTAPEILASIPVLWEGKRVPIVFMFVMQSSHTQVRNLWELLTRKLFLEALYQVHIFSTQESILSFS